MLQQHSRTSFLVHMHVDLLQTLSLVSSLLQAFYFCFYIFSIGLLVEMVETNMSCGQSVDTSTGCPHK